MLIFKALHILSMFAAVTLLVGLPIFVALAIWQRDVRGLAAIYRLARRPGNTVVGGAFLLAGVVFGLLTAATGGFEFFAGWLIDAYVLVAALILSNLVPREAQSAAGCGGGGRGGGRPAPGRRGPARYGDRSNLGLRDRDGALCGDHRRHGPKVLTPGRNHGRRVQGEAAEDGSVRRPPASDLIAGNLFDEGSRAGC